MGTFDTHSSMHWYFGIPHAMNLGVIFYTFTSFSLQMHALSVFINISIFFPYICSFSSEDAAKVLVHSLIVMSFLLLISYHSIAQLIFFACKYSYASSFTLASFPFTMTNLQFLCLLLHAYTPFYLSSLISIYNPPRILHFSNTNLLTRPSISLCSSFFLSSTISFVSYAPHPPNL